MITKKTLGSKVFDISNYVLLSICSILMFFPLLYTIGGSLTSNEELSIKKIVLIPMHPTFIAYSYILKTDIIMKSLLVSLFITIVGTLINLVFTCLMAYPLSRKNLRGRRGIMIMVVFTMLFSGGMIPTYLVVKMMHLLNTYWSLWLPVAISAFNLVLIKNFFQQIPAEMEESAKIDGANDIIVLFKIVLPLSAPALAAFALFYAVGHWNSYFSALMYINDMKKWPIQVWLRQIVIMSQNNFADASSNASDIQIPSETIKLAVICFATMPILMIYPFLQKHFAKGVMLGSVKG